MNRRQISWLSDEIRMFDILGMLAHSIPLSVKNKPWVLPKMLILLSSAEWANKELPLDSGAPKTDKPSACQRTHNMTRA